MSDLDITQIPKLGFGCMRLPRLTPDDETDLDVEQVKQMVDAFIEGGGTYFDTAYIYGGGASERALREALVQRHPRDSYTVATKCLAWSCPNEQAAKDCLNVSLERLGLDYVDFYLIHNTGGKRTAKFDEYGMWDYLVQKKEEGLIRHIGFSMHDGPETLDMLLTEHPQMEFVQLQVNYLDWDDPVTRSRECMEVAAKHGKPVVIMEPARGGLLCNLPDRVTSILKEAAPDRSIASWAYRFCYNLPNVLTVLSGMSTTEQMNENLADWHANEPFTKRERAALEAALAELKNVDLVPCTNCGYCAEACTQDIKIPITMGLLNLEAMTGDHEFVKDLYSWQTSEGRPSDCGGCGACEDMCPQSIDIRNQLKRAVRFYED
ncbi:MAG: aldo/keto reductase [Coriobacteriaceae bacterium]|nr:aldo/keto reductase [Coriobacteriaceae bacterium]